MKLEAAQVAVVTGAASGIGRALAEAFAARGLHVVLADVEAQPLRDVGANLADAGVEVVTAAVDVRDAEQVDGLARRTLDQLGRVDVVCNNAGVVGPRLPTWQQRLDDWRWVLEVNLWGVVHGLRAFVPHLVARGRGHVVNVASIAGLAPIPGGGNGPYAASKHAVVGLSETLRTDLDAVAPGVGVTVVCPGPVATRIREAERNRPAELRSAGDVAGADPPVFSHGMPTLPPDDVARLILDAVEQDRFYLLPNRGTAAAARARVQRLLAELPPD